MRARLLLPAVQQIRQRTQQDAGKHANQETPLVQGQPGKERNQAGNTVSGMGVFIIGGHPCGASCHCLINDRSVGQGKTGERLRGFSRPRQGR
ncbi:hypothetical protein [Xenorhabdus bovienii]|uniref:hypothetical protein n=1 Tax=Xenorhabdus bovienii TaxID=40576 RepID=UPI0023B27CB7|nr:hypothetical protein [Xenorhabdus bovienii]MDE9466868.1 hypothetical protein [Xenorhabdus bovienii]